jgi:hypothetical protein
MEPNQRMEHNARHYYIVTSPDHVVEVWVKRDPRKLADAFYSLDFCSGDHHA